MTGKPATILIADDHELLRDMLARRLAEEPDLRVVGVAADASAAVQQALQQRPDLLLTDIDMPGLSVFEAAREIAERLPGTRIVFLSAYVCDGFIAQALELRASGYLTKYQTGVIEGAGECAAPDLPGVPLLPDAEPGDLVDVGVLTPVMEAELLVLMGGF